MLNSRCLALKNFFSGWLEKLVVLVVLIFSVGVLLWLPPQQVEQVQGDYELAKLEDEYRRTLAQILGGLALLYGLYLTQRRIVATEENVKVAEEGQITERFTRAIEQLGKDKMAIRLGGIYALERLAKDSEKDHGPIMEVLTAYVRENAPRQEEDTQNCAKKPPTDIQAILTVIGRRKTTDIRKFDDILDLTNTQLAGADLLQANLVGVNLGMANLDKARLNGADLNNAILTGANLSKVWLGGAKNLKAEQIQDAENWRDAYLPGYLNYLKDLPDPPA